MNENVFLLRLDRRDLLFEPGQYLTLCPPNTKTSREYSIYSSPAEDHLEFLIKDVGTGGVSSKLHQCRGGDFVSAEGPLGNFTVPSELCNRPLMFVAAGTGISPFHSMAAASSTLRYQIVHGVPTERQLYGRTAFAPENYTPCLSKQKGTGFHGRVTTYLRTYPQPLNTNFFLCGSADMIFEAFEILREQGVLREQIFAEIYY